jgi:hypothetical protein
MPVPLVPMLALPAQLQLFAILVLTTRLVTRLRTAPASRDSMMLELPSAPSALPSARLAMLHLPALLASVRTTELLSMDSVCAQLDSTKL